MGYFDRFNKGKYKSKSKFGKIWYFIWHEDSIESWLINIVLALIIIKYLVYPGLGLVFATTHPIVAVVSSSMHHGMPFDEYWENAHSWYEQNGISKEDFSKFSMKNGFNKGDIMLLFGRDPDKIKIGDIIVFIGARSRARPDPIIHRVVSKHYDGNEPVFVTKGDNFRTNRNPIEGCGQSGCLNETDIRQQQIIGKAFIRVPYLGYVKIWAVDFACLFKDFNFCIEN